MNRKLIAISGVAFLLFVSMVMAGALKIYNPSDNTYPKIRPSYPLPTMDTKGTITRKETSQDLNSAALDYTTDFGARTRVYTILMHVTSNITDSATITFNSITGVSYDTVINTDTFTNSADVSYSPSGELVLASGDELDVDCTNNTGSGTVYVTVIGETLTP